MNAQPLKFYASNPHPCGYLAQQTAVSLFADPQAPMDTRVYSLLIDHGFRRSGEHVYRPYCPDCQQCVPVRVAVEDFRPNRAQRRCLKRNTDLSLHCVDTHQDEHFTLYRRYIRQRHPGGSMDDPDPARYRGFIDSHWCETLFYEFRLGDELVGVAVTDRLEQGLSAFYTFFDPALSQRRSLGTLAILWQVEQCRNLGLPWLYLGYWIADCAKMRYKTRFQPLQGLLGDRWRELNPKAS